MPLHAASLVQQLVLELLAHTFSPADPQHVLLINDSSDSLEMYYATLFFSQRTQKGGSTPHWAFLILVVHRTPTHISILIMEGQVLT